MGTYRIDRASASADAQRFFRQGMSLQWGFNPAEATRAFRRAAEIDPDCALCWWGVAWSLGPTINADMGAGAHDEIHSALARARAARSRNARTDALLAALAARHPASGLDEPGYAKAMQRVATRFADDAQIATLAAEALLDLHPYDWWDARGRPRPWTPRIESLLARALRLHPDHPGANHYSIHLYEASPSPQRALPSARVLETVVPGAGHLLHMPAHVYMRVGRYAEASAAGERAIAADSRYRAEVDASGAYRVGYAAHNPHFLWASSSMEGRSEVALAAARSAYAVACGPERQDRSTGLLQQYYVLPLYALVRFGRWREILDETLPPDVAEPYPLAIWRYARGTAYAKTGQLEAARTELAKLQALSRSPVLAAVRIKNINAAATIVAIAALTLQADVDIASGNGANALGKLRQATALEDGLAYDEPHLWLAPTRQALGSALLDQRRFVDAEAVFREDLARYPNNGWSLLGLAQALRGQGRMADAEAADARFRSAWAAADVALARPRL